MFHWEVNLWNLEIALWEDVVVLKTWEILVGERLEGYRLI